MGRAVPLAVADGGLWLFRVEGHLDLVHNVLVVAAQLLVLLLLAALPLLLKLVGIGKRGEGGEVTSVALYTGVCCARRTLRRFSSAVWRRRSAWSRSACVCAR